jgi:uncharacterized protein YdeI (YjbR/CyaY-like superfamily)
LREDAAKLRNMKNLLEIKDRAAWRAWLEKHGATTKEVWLVYYKKSSGKPRIAYQDAVEEALCFGWIDGQLRRLDEDRFAQRFTPRKGSSRWSAINIDRAHQLIQQKKMTAAGRAVFHPERQIEASPRQMPPALRKVFKGQLDAWENFQNFPPYYQRMTTVWVAGAKRQETRRKRLQQLIEFSAENKRIKFM